ncbi:TonB-dependent hemoglobin/transferrin/lactoferrin family receptor [Endozoicomonas sp. 4G]|uniref:TonB-dependent hemoglobin/transferrin/lactoferrin family receptor n=1 Tax=Endozoicomonas sp. 4G TaxID=2872754 RepID=UPI002078CAF2|nr:TonB-dependent hemoglobin/transferrin/lactoferrin family receptor [Endozoicomonas sp. 4G]
MSLSAIQKTHLALAIMAVATATAQAEDALPSTQPTLLDQVTVSATLTEQNLDSVASSVDVTTADDIEKRMVNDIDDLVRYEPGVTVTDDGRTGAGSFNIRGMDANRVKITVDSVDQAKAFDSTQIFLRSQRNFIDLETIKAVEVLKGPASTVHGSDAIGGVVAFVTKDPADFLKHEGDDGYVSLKGGYSSADSAFTETATFANRSGDLESLLIYTRRDAKETRTHGGADVTGDARGEADPKDIGINNVLGKLQYQVNDNHRVGLTAEWRDLNSKTDLLSMVGAQPTGNPSPYGKFNADDSTRRQRLGLFHEWEAFAPAFDTLKWTLNWQETETNQITYDEMQVETGSFPKWETQARHKDYVYRETSWQLGLNMTKWLDFKWSDHLISYGLELERKEQNNLNKTTYVKNPAGEKNDISRYAPLATVDSAGFYLQDEISFLDDRLTVTPGIRYDSFSPKTETDQYYQKAYKDQSYDSWSGKLGAVYKFTDVFSGFAQYSQGFGTPDLFAMYFEEIVPLPVSIHVMPNPNLKPEKSDSIEVGLRANGRLGSAEITAFYNRYDDFIELVPLGIVNREARFQYQNLDDTTIKGLEFKGQLWLDEAMGAPTGTSFKTAVAWSEGQGTFSNDKGELFKDDPLNSIAPLTAVIGLAYDAPSDNWGGELMWTLVAAKDKNDISNSDIASDESEAGGEQFATPGYGIVDMTAYYKPIKDVTLTAGMFNITDKKYWKWDDVRGLPTTYEGLNRYTQPGRNFAVSVKWEI